MRTLIQDPVSQERIHAYRLSKDCGNVLYKDSLVKILDSAEKMNEIFGPTVATAEKAGDVIEFWLGLLDIAAMTKDVINIFGDGVDPSKYLNGLEAAVRLFSKVARTTSTINSKRKGSFDCSLGAREVEEVTNRLNQVDTYQRPALFHYLTAAEATMVLELNNNFIHARGSMDTSSSANPDIQTGSPNQRVQGGTPEGEQSSQVAEEYVKSGKQMVLEALGSLFTILLKHQICACIVGQLSMNILNAITETKRSSRAHLTRLGHVCKKENQPRQKLTSPQSIRQGRDKMPQQTPRLRKRSLMMKMIRQWVKCTTSPST